MSVRLIIAGIFLILGLFMYCVCVLGLFRFNNVLDRMHAAAVGDTMGMFLTIAGLVILSDNFFQAVKLVCVVVFIWLTSPVATHLIGKVEILTNNETDRGTRRKKK